MRQGSFVEIRYIGRDTGIVDKGIVKAIHGDGTMDIELESFPYGIKFSVLPEIVHEVAVSAQFQSGLDTLMPEETPAYCERDLRDAPMFVEVEEREVLSNEAKVALATALLGGLDVLQPDLHTDDCNAARTRRQIERDAWVVQFPNFCRACNATGGHQSGGSLYEPPEFIPCRVCLAHGRCPRCGTPGADADAVIYAVHPVCQKCGWNSSEDDHAPFVPKCVCNLTGGLPDSPLGPLEEYPY